MVKVTDETPHAVLVRVAVSLALPAQAFAAAVVVEQVPAQAVGRLATVRCVLAQPGRKTVRAIVFATEQVPKTVIVGVAVSFAFRCFSLLGTGA